MGETKNMFFQSRVQQTFFVKGLIVNILDCGPYISNYASVQEHPEMISKWLEMAVSQHSFNCQH